MKMIKRILALTLILALTFALTGCSWLDELRQRQAFLDGDTITYQGEIYQRLPDCDFFFPEVDASRYISPSAPDMPVLLSPFVSPYFFSEDENFLISPNGDQFYCRQEMHAQMSQRIRNGFTPETIGYRYTHWENAEESSIRWYALKEDQIAMLETICSTVEPQRADAGWSLDYDWSLRLYESSEDLLFRQPSRLRIAAAGITYYLILDSDEGQLIFKAPHGTYNKITDIAKAYLGFVGYQKRFHSET